MDTERVPSKFYRHSATHTHYQLLLSFTEINLNLPLSREGWCRRYQSSHRPTLTKKILPISFRNYHLIDRYVTCYVNFSVLQTGHVAF